MSGHWRTVVRQNYLTYPPFLASRVIITPPSIVHILESPFLCELFVDLFMS
jgi:hypothetical protein